MPDTVFPTFPSARTGFQIDSTRVPIRARNRDLDQTPLRRVLRGVFLEEVNTPDFTRGALKQPVHDFLSTTRRPYYAPEAHRTTEGLTPFNALADGHTNQLMRDLYKQEQIKSAVALRLFKENVIGRRHPRTIIY